MHNLRTSAYPCASSDKKGAPEGAPYTRGALLLKLYRVRRVSDVTVGGGGAAGNPVEASVRDGEVCT
jgi:hypothetical protein